MSVWEWISLRKTLYKITSLFCYKIDINSEFKVNETLQLKKSVICYKTFQQNKYWSSNKVNVCVNFP